MLRADRPPPKPEHLLRFVRKVEQVDRRIAALNLEKSRIYDQAHRIGLAKRIVRAVVEYRRTLPAERGEVDEEVAKWLDAVYRAELRQEFGRAEGPSEDDGPLDPWIPGLPGDEAPPEPL